MTELVLVTEKLTVLAYELDAQGPWTECGGALWLPLSPHKVRDLALAMKAAHARFITITATEMPGNEGISLDYLWDLDGRAVGFRIQTANNSIDSISSLCEAADWIEREIHDGWAVEFAGRTTEALLLRKSDTAGVNLRKEGE